MYHNDLDGFLTNLLLPKGTPTSTKPFELKAARGSLQAELRESFIDDGFGANRSYTDMGSSKLMVCQGLKRS